MPVEAFRPGDQFAVAHDRPGAASEDVDVAGGHNVVNIRAERSRCTPKAR